MKEFFIFGVFKANPLPYFDLDTTGQYYKYNQYNTIQYNTIQYNKIKNNTIQYKTIQFNKIQYNTIQYNTIKYIITLCAVSSGSPPLMRIPFCAPTPVPTITAVGVARPRAQGQAMARTEIAQRNANWNVISDSVYKDRCKNKANM